MSEVLKRASILEKSRAWTCPNCGTRYPGEQDRCVVCEMLKGEKK